MVLDTEYYSEEPVSIGGADENGEDDHGDGAGGGGSTGPGGSYTPPAPPPEAIAPGGKPLSARLYDELAMQRRDVLAATTLRQPALALDHALRSEERSVGKEVVGPMRSWGSRHHTKKK